MTKGDKTHLITYFEDSCISSQEVNMIPSGELIKEDSEVIVEIPVFDAVTRGIWKQVSYTSKRVMVEDQIIESMSNE